MHNVGFFAYSREENTRAYFMKGQVAEFIKKRRLKKIQSMQSQILIEYQQNFVGKTLNCVCESTTEDGIYVFRSEYNSPDVDTYIYVQSSKPLKLNEFYNIKITNILNEDLQGEIV